MTRKRRRLYMVLAGMAALAIAVAFVLVAFRDNLVFFYSPSEVAAKHVPPGRKFRIGGLVEAGSVDRQGTLVHFKVTDTVNAVPVSYTGLLPDLFREGQGVVAEGTLNNQGQFVAVTILAKHDEKYMPPEVAEALKRAGEWRPDGEAAPVVRKVN